MKGTMQIKNFFKIIVIISFCFIDVFSAYSEDKQSSVLTLDIDKAINMAFEASEDLQISDNALQRKMSEQKEESSYALPHILGAVEWSNNFEYPDIAATAIQKDYHFGTGVTASQTLFTFGRISNAIDAAKKAVSSSSFNKKGTEQFIIYNTKLAYYSVYLAKRTFEIAGESYENAKQNKNILELRSAQGRVSKYDNIKISADISSRMPSVNNARADLVSALETLKVIIGVDTQTEVTLSEGFSKDYPELDYNMLVMALYKNQPAIKALDETIKEKEYLVKSTKATMMPEVSGFVSWNHKGDSDNYYIGSDNLDDYGVAGIKVSIPIWMGGISREKLYQAKIDHKDAELQYQKGKKDYLLMLDKAVNQYREYKRTLESNEESIRWSEESFKYSQELFSSGQLTVTDLNDAELQLTQAKLSREVTLFNLNIILAQIERLTLIGQTNE